MPPGRRLLDSNGISLLRQISVNVEQISYCQNEDQVRSKGKGYEDGELLDFALKNSIFFKN